MQRELPENTDYIQCHKAIIPFNYDLAIDWAINLIELGFESENILMLASFVKPTESREINSYVTNVMEELNLEKKEGDNAQLTHIYFLVRQLKKGNNLKKILREITNFYFDYDVVDIDVFRNLNYSWEELEYDNVTYYMSGVNLKNIEEIAIKEANLWIDEFIHKKSIERNDYSIPMIQQPEIVTKKINKNYIKKKRTLLEKIKFYFIPNIK